MSEINLQHSIVNAFLAAQHGMRGLRGKLFIHVMDLLQDVHQVGLACALALTHLLGENVVLVFSPHNEKGDDNTDQCEQDTDFGENDQEAGYGLTHSFTPASTLSSALA